MGMRERNIVEQVKLISAHVDEIGSTLRRLSHELHPVMLEQLGVPASIGRLCDETAAATRIAIRREIRPARSWADDADVETGSGQLSYFFTRFACLTAASDTSEIF